MTNPKIKLLLLSKYSNMGASSRVCTLGYVDEFQKNNILVTVNNLFNDDYLKRLYAKKKKNFAQIFIQYFKRLICLFTIFKYDIVWIEKEIFPFCPAIIERLLSLFGVKYVVDYDDAIFHNYDQSKNLFIKLFLSKKIDVVMSKATCVIARNYYLFERAEKAKAKKVKLFLSAVDISKYSVKKDQNTINQPLVIGWIGSPSTQKYLIDIKESLVNVCKQFNASLLIVGATPDILDHFPNIDITLKKWDEKTENSLIQEMSVGIMPLVDNLWERGKCGYKLIQYMACGVPVVGSAVGINTNIINDSKAGYLATTNDEWVTSLSKLLSSKKLRQDMGLLGRDAVEKVYSKDIRAQELVSFFQSVSKRE